METQNLYWVILDTIHYMETLKHYYEKKENFIKASKIQADIREVKTRPMNIIPEGSIIEIYMREQEAKEA